MKLVYIVRTGIDTFINEETISLFKKMYNAGEDRNSMKEKFHDIHWDTLWKLMFSVSKETGAPLLTPVFDEYEDVEVGRDINISSVHLILTGKYELKDYETITIFEFLMELLEDYKLNQLSIEL